MCVATTFYPTGVFAKHDWNDPLKEDYMGRTCSSNGRTAFRLLVVKADGRRVMGRPTLRWIVF
jgi:hypothetical protein